MKFGISGDLLLTQDTIPPAKFAVFFWFVCTDKG